MRYTNIQIVQALDRLRIDSLYVHNAEFPGAAFTTGSLKGRKVYLVETLVVLNALVSSGTMMLYGGHGGGKTTLSKYLGQIFCHKSSREIEDCVLRGHPQLTEEKILGTLDFAQILGKKELNKEQKLDVVWNEFVTSEWKIVDEINRLSPYAQNILLSLLAEGVVKYYDQSMKLPSFTLYATLNPKDNATTELSLPFRDRFAIALPISMPDYDSFSTIGVSNSIIGDELSHLLPGEFSLAALQDDVEKMEYTEDAEHFIDYIIASYHLCERVSKESNDAVSVNKSLCENCRWNTQEKVCNKIRQPLSVRVKKDLYRYGKALAWFLGDSKVEVHHIEILAPYMIWHRSMLSKKYFDGLIRQWRDQGGDEKQQEISFFVNIDLDGTREIISKIREEFDGVKDLLSGFDRIKRGEFSIDEFHAYMDKIQSPTYNSLLLLLELIPTLKRNYEPVYAEIVDIKNQIESARQMSELKKIQEKLINKYELPNRQYLSNKIGTKLRQLTAKSFSYELSREQILESPPLLSRILSKTGVDLNNRQSDIKLYKDYVLYDIANPCDEYTLKLKKVDDTYNFRYKGGDDTEMYCFLDMKAKNDND